MRADQLARYARDPVAFLDDFVKVNERGQPFALFPHQREILHAAFDFDAEGRLPWDTFVYACPKKSGKTTINGALMVWWAFTQEAPNELLALANDFEQARDRHFAAAAKIIAKNEALAPSATVETKRVVLSNGTEIRALASEYTSSAGSDHGLTSTDELWGYTSEAALRLFEELTPVPTRRNSIRLITTYAGWEGESKLLWDIYRAGVSPEEHPEGQAERVHPTLPLYFNRAARLFVYWDHEPRMPWQTPHYYEAQRRALRPGTYLRLHENRWTTAASTFITPELWDPLVDATRTPLLPTKDVALHVGVDASTKSDTSGVVAVYREGSRIILAQHRIWRPSSERPLDIAATIEEYLKWLHEAFRLREVLCDPYQLHKMITDLAKLGLPIREFPQTVPNTTLMGSTLFDVLKGRNLVLYRGEELRTQALNTVAIESPRGWRIAKEKASRKIDGIVSLAMACVSAAEHAPGGALQVYAYALSEGRAVNVDGLHTISRERRFLEGLPFGTLESTDAAGTDSAPRACLRCFHVQAEHAEPTPCPCAVAGCPCKAFTTNPNDLMSPEQRFELGLA